MRITKPKLVLFDANIIIEAYVMGIWREITDRVTVHVPSIVVKNEALFFKGDIGRIPEEIHLQSIIQDGKIFECSAQLEELAALSKIFNDAFLENIHDGEREALAILTVHPNKNLLFCTADAMPIKGIAMLRLAERGISFERLLKTIGIHKQLRKHFTEKWFNIQLAKGRQNLITGEGLKSDYRDKLSII